MAQSFGAGDSVGDGRIERLAFADGQPTSLRSSEDYCCSASLKTRLETPSRSTHSCLCLCCQTSRG
jgi:hypothetical protein